MSGKEIRLANEKHEALVLDEPKTRTARPPFYKVLLLNDDFTPMDFVVLILMQVFHKPQPDALDIMLEVHNRGSGLCGVFTRDVAETKVDQVVAISRKHEHPLQCVMEKE